VVRITATISIVRQGLPVFENPAGGPTFRSEESGPIMDTVLSLLISAGIIAFGLWVVVAGTITAGRPWTLMGLLAVIVGLLSLYGSV
jgi:hypothetical protein